MTTNKERVITAFRAMKSLGIQEGKTKPVLKKLLKVYDKNWALIEEENYRVLVDAIFESEDAEVMEKNPISEINDRGEVLEEEEHAEEPEPPLKRLHKKGRDQPPHEANPAVGEPSLKKLKVEPGATLENSRLQAQGASQLPNLDVGSGSAVPGPVSPPPKLRKKGKQPVSSDTGITDKVQEHQAAAKDKRPIDQSMAQAVQVGEGRVEGSVAAVVSKQKNSTSQALIKPKDEPFTDDMPPYQVPLAVVHPESGHGEMPSNITNSAQNNREASKLANGVGKSTAGVASLGKQANKDVPLKAPATLEIAASPLGEVKVSLNCNLVVDRPNFNMPSLDEVVKYMEDKCLRTYKILDPSFSVKNLMRDFCNSFLELGSRPNVRSNEQPQNKLDSSAPSDVVGDGNGQTVQTVSPYRGTIGDNSPDGPADTHVSDPSIMISSPEKSLSPDKRSVENRSDGNETSSPGYANMSNMVVVHQLNLDDRRRLHDVDDITRGEEKVKVPLLLESNTELLPSFYYIPQSAVSQNAAVNISLAQIGIEDCCSTCFGDCLESNVSCACVYRNGVNFAYTSGGLIKEDFLDECINTVRNPLHHLIYCEVCPIEKCRNEDVLEPCKGHLQRKFIKECWSKCGCSKLCVNRVVQRGITCQLEVFLTPEGKGLGLRTLEDLPKGAFVCEFVGEISTITELQERTLRQRSCDKHSYFILLDSDWQSGVLEPEQALCLDATSYGNVARFINHRCFDANLIGIPVEVDTTNHLYYHVAFFTTRKIDAAEELTWDYGIDFDDPDQHIKAFRCLCGSSYCRKMKRSNRSGAGSSLH